ncbi:ornithine cyclodeaminase family protein [Methylocapsa sp. S129]|uniref:ornithine cyclodeaminase family protein n=1 Tax=Methylocapsa sp. S129 TaxID=1641869 RepID=UPI00131D24C9|nr:ornithine cyclodeaminase family protein [Methylocapsa sp. S129]
MRLVSATEIDEALDFPGLIDALAQAFRGGTIAPTRHHHAIARADATTATHLLMPAWTSEGTQEDAYLGTKIVNVFPDNGRRGLPAVLGVYVLQSGLTGEPLAAMDGTRLTHWRTAAASALAARHLARDDARRLLIVGAGALAPFLTRAHASVRPIEEVTVWNRSAAAAEKLAASLSQEGWRARVAEDLESAVRAADIISCATLSNAPLIAGAWLQPGQHLDLVGAFNLEMREADDEALRRARVFIDTDAALSEGGDVALALRGGAIDRAHIVADLGALCRGAIGRAESTEITLFKSVGAALEDLAAAMLVWRKLAPL